MLHFEIPLEVRRVHRFVLRSVIRRRKEAWISRCKRSQRRPLRESVDERGVVIRDGVERISRNIGRKWNSGRCKSIYVRRVQRESLQDLLREEISKVSDTPANDGLLAAEWRPRKTETWFDGESGGVIERVRNSSLD